MKIRNFKASERVQKVKISAGRMVLGITFGLSIYRGKSALSENFVNGKPVKFICTLLLERCENKQSRTYFQRPNVVVISKVARGGAH
jgi:hypothetical protein